MKLSNIEALLECDGQINIGNHQPIGCIAVANAGSDTLAMLKRHPGETLETLLQRLDIAIARADETGERVDEINPR